MHVRAGLRRGHAGTGYRITRTEQNSGASDIFDGEEDYVNFSISNGTVRFTDNDVEPGRDYDYFVEAVNPFWYDDRPGCTVSISIPAAESDAKPLPATGDGARPVLWAALAMMSAAGLLSILRKKTA